MLNIEETLGPPNRAKRILIVEDDSIVAMDLQQQLGEFGYVANSTASSVDEALTIAATQPFDAVLMDIQLHGARDGIDGARELVARHQLPVVFLTSHCDAHFVARAVQAGACGYLAKPFHAKEVRAAVEIAVARPRGDSARANTNTNIDWATSALQALGDGVVVVEPSGQVRMINRAAERMTGWSGERAAGHPVGEVVQLEAAAPDGRSGDATVDLAGFDWHGSHSLPIARGAMLRHPRSWPPQPVDVLATPLVGERSETLGAVLTLRDARPRLTQETQHLADRERFRSAFDDALLGMLLITAGGEVLQANAAFAALASVDAGSLVGRDVRTLLAEDEREGASRRLAELLDGDAGIVQFEACLAPGADGPGVRALLCASRLRAAADGPVCVLVQVHDLSEQRAASARMVELACERMMREARETVLESGQRLLGQISHEMRTPLNAVIGFAQLLEMQLGGVPETQRWVRQIREAGDYLLRLVQDLTDMSRAQLGELSVRPERLDVARTVASAVELVTPQAQQAGVALGMFLDSQELAVVADPTRLRQILVNLLSNGIKYNRRGGTVSVTARMGARVGRVELAVVDDGAGMDERQLAQLFEPFNRLGAERTGVPGDGLGLAIARALARAMDGDLRVESSPGGGTTFTLDLPAG